MTMPVFNPATETQVATVAMGNEDDVNLAVAAAASAWEGFSKTSKSDRLELLNQLRIETEKRFEDLAQAMRIEMGAPISMARDAQADAALGHLDSFIAALKGLESKKVLETGDIILKEPIGVCGLITPWNWPINQIALKVIPVLATGCACVLKPSEYTPISAMIYAEIIHAAGYPAGVVKLVIGDGPTVGSSVATQPDILMISFTGSTRAGKSITFDAADTIKRLTLELGGKSPNLVFADCDLESRVASSVNECMFNTGQSCDAPTRLLVQRSCYKKVLQIVEAVVKKIQIGDPALEGKHIGPLFDQIQYDRVQAMIKVGIDEGATLLCGGLGKPSDFRTGWFVKPTVFADATNSMRISQEEIFGPVVVIIPFEDEAEAVSMANDTPYGLAAYLQTGDANRALRIASNLRAGAIHINGGEFNYGSPFGGYKQSGNGREGGAMGLEDFLETKTLHGI